MSNCWDNRTKDRASKPPPKTVTAITAAIQRNIIEIALKLGFQLFRNAVGIVTLTREPNLGNGM